MDRIPPRVSNPLTLIAVFSGLAEIAATAVLTQLTGVVQAQFVWFVMLFPILLVVLFFITLNFNHRVLYAPSDYTDERHFMETIKGAYVPDASEAEKIKQFWKPDDTTINRANEAQLKAWMNKKNIQVSITNFLNADRFETRRSEIVGDLNI